MYWFTEINGPAASMETSAKGSTSSIHQQYELGVRSK